MDRQAASKRPRKDPRILAATNPRTILLRSKKFREWTPPRHFRAAKKINYGGEKFKYDGKGVRHAGKTSENLADHKFPIEQHFTPAELANAWGVSDETVRSIFREEPGVLKLGKTGTMHRRGYFTLRIPQEVAKRVHRRLSA